MKPGDVIVIKVAGQPYETIIDKYGTQRFRVNPFFQQLERYKINLNDFALVYASLSKKDKKLSQRSYAEFMMGLGYSVDGFRDLSEFEDMEIENPLWKEGAAS